MQTKQANGRPAVFLDRDGVLIENIDGDYVRTLDQIAVLPGSRDAVDRLLQGGFLPVVVTNQAAVAKGFISLEQAWDIQKAVENAVSPSREIASTLCPHAKTDRCDCRKPKPGMLLEMADKYAINLRQSFLIGDAMTDIAAARAAGVTPILVLSGRGAHQHHQATHQELEDLKVLPSIVEATDYILELKGNNDRS
jgi:D-glycero-D-manno-heptose 1,7-bisphosphate phosphatase